jgi:hypothetical protein
VRGRGAHREACTLTLGHSGTVGVWPILRASRDSANSAPTLGGDYNNTMVVGVRVRPILKTDLESNAQGIAAVRVIERSIVVVMDPGPRASRE